MQKSKKRPLETDEKKISICRNEHLNVSLKTGQTNIPASFQLHTKNTKNTCAHHSRHVIQRPPFHFVNLTLQGGYSFQLFLGVAVSRYTPFLLGILLKAKSRNRCHRWEVGRWAHDRGIQSLDHVPHHQEGRWPDSTEEGPREGTAELPAWNRQPARMSSSLQDGVDSPKPVPSLQCCIPNRLNQWVLKPREEKQECYHSAGFPLIHLGNHTSLVCGIDVLVARVGMLPPAGTARGSKLNALAPMLSAGFSCQWTSRRRKELLYRSAGRYKATRRCGTTGQTGVCVARRRPIRACATTPVFGFGSEQVSTAGKLPHRIFPGCFLAKLHGSSCLEISVQQAMMDKYFIVNLLA